MHVWGKVKIPSPFYAEHLYTTRSRGLGDSEAPVGFLILLHSIVAVMLKLHFGKCNDGSREICVF